MVQTSYFKLENARSPVGIESFEPFSGRNVHIRLLGTVAITTGRTTDIKLGGPNPRRLIAFLALSPNRTVSLDRLVDLVWDGQPPSSARRNVQTYIWSLRRALDQAGHTDRLITRRPGYELRAYDEEIDYEHFKALIRRAQDLRASEPAAAAHTMSSALALWRGSALADIVDSTPQLQPYAAVANEQRLQALEAQAAAELESESDNETLLRLGELVAEHPLREGLHELYVTALYRSRRRIEALAAHRAFQAALASQLGLDPSPRLRRLERRILNDDPNL